MGKVSPQMNRFDVDFEECFLIDNSKENNKLLCN